MTDSTRILYAGNYLTLASRNGWELVSRRHRVVVLIAWTPARELLLVEQFRIPVDCRTIELPAGLVGDEDGRAQESLMEAAARELEEETGWRAGRLEVIMPCPTSAGMTDEMAVFIRARDLVRIDAGGGDDSEDIVVHRVKRDGIDEWLDARRRDGLAIDPKVYTALYWS